MVERGGRWASERHTSGSTRRTATAAPAARRIAPVATQTFIQTRFYRATRWTGRQRPSPLRRIAKRAQHREHDHEDDPERRHGEDVETRLGRHRRSYPAEHHAESERHQEERVTHRGLAGLRAPWSAS